MSFSKKTILVMLATILTFSCLAMRGGIANAATRTSIALSNPVQMQKSAYTVSLTTSAAGQIKGIKMKWHTIPNMPSFPISGGWSSSSFSGEVLGTTNPNSWTLNKRDAASGILYVTDPNGDLVSSNTRINWTISNIGNAAIASSPIGCSPNPNDNHYGSCYVTIHLFNTDSIDIMQREVAENVVDEAEIRYQIYDRSQDPLVDADMQGGTATDSNDITSWTTKWMRHFTKNHKFLFSYYFMGLKKLFGI